MVRRDFVHFGPPPARQKEVHGSEMRKEKQKQKATEGVSHGTASTSKSQRPIPQDPDDAFISQQQDNKRVLALAPLSQKLVDPHHALQNPAELRETGTSGTYEFGMFDPHYQPIPTAPVIKVDPNFPNARVVSLYPTIRRKEVPDLEMLPDDHIDRHDPPNATQAYYLDKAAKAREQLEKKKKKKEKNKKKMKPKSAGKLQKKK